MSNKEKSCECNQTIKESWGTEEREGLNYCHFCDLISDSSITVSQVEDSDFEEYEYKHSLNKTIRDGNVPLYTTFDVPGKQVIESLGMISGVGNAMFTLTGTSARITNRATTKALNNLFAEAQRIEADAVVGVNLALDSFAKGWVQQLAVFTGTAVRFKK